MKKFKKNPLLHLTIASALLFFVAGLLSFSSPKGGEGFEIFLGNKLLCQQFGVKTNALTDVQLDQHSASSQLIIKYYHCGGISKNRYITVKDVQDRLLKQWHFDDASGGNTSMICDVKDILNLKKGHSTLKLYYSSSELPAGRQLATLVTN